MPADPCIGIALPPFHQQLFQCVHLGIGEMIAPDEADPQAFGVVTVNMRPDPEFRAAAFNHPVTGDDSMIANPVSCRGEEESSKNRYVASPPICAIIAEENIKK